MLKMPQPALAVNAHREGTASGLWRCRESASRRRRRTSIVKCHAWPSKPP